jgi:sialate O-acetylesterase
MNRYLILSIALFAAATTARAEVKLHALFTDGAVLQRDLPVPVWGTASGGEDVTVSLAGQTASAKANADGRWSVKLKPLAAGGPHTLKVEGTNKLEVKDVLVGEVWVCSGQSNMSFSLANADNGPAAIAASENPNLRLFQVPLSAQTEPQSEVKAQWKPCNPQNVPGFSAVGYFFGRDLQKALGVPVGLINSSVGGTPAQAWTSRAVLESSPAGKPHLDAYAETMKNAEKLEEQFAKATEAWKVKAAEAKAAKQPAPRAPRPPAHRNNGRPACLYNGMIAPLVPYAMRGAIWYQGEANASAPENYRELLPAMIGGWRADFNPDLAFLIVQLAPYDVPPPEAWAWFRETQRQIALNTPKSGLAAIPDAGEPRDIHPKRKEPVGQRLALVAEGTVYGQKIEWSGPTLKDANFTGGKAALTLDHAGGLGAKDGPPSGFIIAGEDKKFVPAEAKIVKGAIEVSSPQVPAPKAVRYAWKNMPDGNLWNAAGLPASPFRTDDWPRPAAPAAAKP